MMPPSGPSDHRAHVGRRLVRGRPVPSSEAPFISALGDRCDHTVQKWRLRRLLQGKVPTKNRGCVTYIVAQLSQMCVASWQLHVVYVYIYIYIYTYIYYIYIFMYIYIYIFTRFSQEKQYIYIYIYICVLFGCFVCPRFGAHVPCVFGKV